MTNNNPLRPWLSTEDDLPLAARKRPQRMTLFGHDTHDSQSDWMYRLICNLAWATDNEPSFWDLYGKPRWQSAWDDDKGSRTDIVAVMLGDQSRVIEKPDDSVWLTILEYQGESAEDLLDQIGTRVDGLGWRCS
jgi:hypothetical protein